MMETLDTKDRVARKDHVCDFCCGTIKKGETYSWSKHVCDGRLYEWKSHKKCDYLCSQLWEYADPDEGMNTDTFWESLRDFCQVFVCRDCPKWDKECACCIEDYEFCIDKAYDILQTHELYMERDGYYQVWKLRERKNDQSNSNK